MIGQVGEAGGTIAKSLAHQLGKLKEKEDGEA